MMSTSAGKIEIAQPRLFVGPRVIGVALNGLFLVIPVFIAIAIMSVFTIGMALSVVIPVLTVVATAFFLPLGLGNAQVTNLVRRITPAAGTGADDFIVQLTLAPRLRSGLRALLEDADDIGSLRFDKSQLVFQGDSIRLSLPGEQIQEVGRQNIGMRGLFVYGPRIRVAIAGLPQVASLEFAERSSWLLPTSRRTTEKLFQRLLRAANERT
jgi:hypothetical protein